MLNHRTKVFLLNKYAHLFEYEDIIAIIDKIVHKNKCECSTGILRCKYCEAKEALIEMIEMGEA